MFFEKVNNGEVVIFFLSLSVFLDLSISFNHNLAKEK